MEEKKLYRNEKNAILGGVCSGIGNYFGIDIVLVRLIAIVLGLVSWWLPSLVIYAAAWLIIPKRSE